MPVSIDAKAFGRVEGHREIRCTPQVGLLHYGFELEKENHFFQSSNKNRWANRISDWFKKQLLAGEGDV